jgi:hypothetical protein
MLKSLLVLRLEIEIFLIEEGKIVIEGSDEK